MSNLLFVLSVSDELRLALHRGPAVSGFEFRFCTLRIRETAVPEPCGREWDRPSVRSTRMGFRSANSLQSSSPDSWAAKKSYPHFRSFVSSFERTTSSCNELCNERLLNFDGKWFKGKQFFRKSSPLCPTSSRLMTNTRTVKASSDDRPTRTANGKKLSTRHDTPTGTPTTSIP